MSADYLISVYLLPKSHVTRSHLMGSLVPSGGLGWTSESAAWLASLPEAPLQGSGTAQQQHLASWLHCDNHSQQHHSNSFYCRDNHAVQWSTAVRSLVCSRLAARHASKGSCPRQTYLHQGGREEVDLAVESQHLCSTAGTGRGEHAHLVAARHAERSHLCDVGLSACNSRHPCLGGAGAKQHTLPVSSCCW